MGRSRYWTMLAVSALLLTLSGPSTIAAPAVPGDGARDCSLEANVWPARGSAYGVAFLGRVLGKRSGEEGTSYRMSVIRSFEGHFRDSVRLKLDCLDLPLRIGERYLIGSARSRSTDGAVERVLFNDAHAVAWHVGAEGRLRLVEYGAPGLPPDYLLWPRTLPEGVEAATLRGVEADGYCGRGAYWHLEVEGGLAYARIHDEPFQVWRVRLSQDGETFFDERLGTNGGEIAEVEAGFSPDGPDTVRLRAWEGTEDVVCKGSVTLP